MEDISESERDFAKNTGVMKPDFREPVLDYCAEIQRRKILFMAQIWPSTGTEEIYWPSRNETTHRKKCRGS
jgi:hypothetical protein